MKALLLLVMTLLLPQTPAPSKNDPSGVWQSDTGTKFSMKLSDSVLKVQLVDGSNPVYVKYEVNLKNTGEANTYEGSGYFVAKVQDKECKFDTNWAIVVAQPEVIAGSISHIVPDPATCEVRERRAEFIQLNKVK